MKKAQEVHFKNRLGPITFGSPKKYPPLQAADLLAYEARRKTIDEVAGIPPRRSLIRLMSSGRIEFSYIDDRWFEPIWKNVITDPDYEDKIAEMETLVPKAMRPQRKPHL